MNTHYGQGLTYEECEALYQKLDGKHRKSLDVYYDSRWFDYTHDYRIQCLYRYVGAYNDCIKLAKAKYVDYRLVEKFKGTSEADILNCTKFTLSGYIKGLGFANYFCLPYEVYIDLAIENYMGFRSQRCLPRPADLYNKFFICKVMEYKRNPDRRVLLAKDEYYKVENYCNEPRQRRYYEYLTYELLITKEGRAMIASGFHKTHLPIEYQQILFARLHQ